MPNLTLEREHALSPFRKMALGTWRTAYDPSVYGSLVLRVDAALAYLAAIRQATGKHVTLTHLLGKAAGDILAELPEVNVMLRAGRIHRRRDIGVFFQVATKDPASGAIDLSGATIHDPQTKSLVEISDELERRFAAVRAHRDPVLDRTRGLLARLPAVLMPAALRLSSFASYTLNLDLRWAGIPHDAFGSMMITNIGALGLEEAYVPLVPYSRVPLLLAVGAITDTPVVRDGRVEVAKTVKLCATFDHRLLDGAHAAAMASRLRSYLEDPVGHFGKV